MLHFFLDSRNFSLALFDPCGEGCSYLEVEMLTASIWLWFLIHLFGGVVAGPAPQFHICLGSRWNNRKYQLYQIKTTRDIFEN